MAYATHTHITSWRYALAPYLAAEKKKLVKPCRSENEIKKKKKRNPSERYANWCVIFPRAIEHNGIGRRFIRSHMRRSVERTGTAPHTRHRLLLAQRKLEVVNGNTTKCDSIAVYRTMFTNFMECWRCRMLSSVHRWISRQLTTCVSTLEFTPETYIRICSEWWIKLSWNGLTQ